MMVDASLVPCHDIRRLFALPRFRYSQDLVAHRESTERAGGALAVGSDSPGLYPYFPCTRRVHISFQQISGEGDLVARYLARV